MELAQYTPDAICRSMGLPAFVEPDWKPSTLRLLLKPSFHPEVCVTLTNSDDAARLSVVALTEMLWSLPYPRVMEAWREEIIVPVELFREVSVGFAAALAASRERNGIICVDGMPVAACLLSDAGIEQFACSPYRPEVSDFVASLAQIAWDSCRTAGVRNALAACGRYVGLKLPRDPVPPPPEFCRVAVLGTPDERAEFLEMLQSSAAASERGAPDSPLPRP